MKFMRGVSAGLLGLALAAAAAPTAAAEQSPWYLGGGIGHSDARRSNSWAERTDILLFQQSVTSLTRINSGETSWKLFGGYDVNENFAVEAAYVRLGKYSGTSSVTGPAAGTGNGTWDARGVSVAAVGILPVHENRVSLIAKGGFAYLLLDVNVTAPRAGTIVALNPSDNRTNLMLGLGVRFDFNKKFGLRADYEHYNNVGDGSTTGQSAISVWSLNGLFHF
jgi:OOP family OmpA-OmpF porin